MIPKTKPKIAFRADASILIGNGHVMRCLTLASVLKARDAECIFICRSHEGHLIDFIRQQGFSVETLPRVRMRQDLQEPQFNAGNHEHWLGVDWKTDALQTGDLLIDPVDLIVVDHYAIDGRWEASLRKHARRLMVLDDLADRRHDCDLLLDQNLGSSKQDYTSLVPKEAELLIGQDYALLRPEFENLRQYSLKRRSNAEAVHLLIALGGVDKDNITQRVLAALNRTDFGQALDVTIVLGPNAPWRDSVVSEAAKAKYQTRVLSSVSDMATLMANADIAIGAAGSTSWERCALGVPTILVILAENQKTIGGRLSDAGAATLLELNDDFEVMLNSSLGLLLNNKHARNEMIENAACICDGKGALRVADSVSELLCN